jgi:4-amino-4-deoxy-L-arabinose transferase-like glycosyltransferase
LCLLPATNRFATSGVFVSRLAVLILATTLIRLAFAWATGLGIDESYMVAAGRVLSLGYFDHPPVSWWLAWGASHLAGAEDPIIVRLPFILLFALSTWLMGRIGTELSGERTGFWAAVLLNLSPVFTLTTGSWVLPDGPLDCALLGAALCLIRALPSDRGRAWRGWVGAGLCAGLALASKYSAILTIGGAFLYLATSPTHRAWLRRPAPYLSALLALLVFSPVIVWNATHGWASFAFQGQRAEGLSFHPFAPLVTLGGEALFVLPWIWLPMMLVAIAAIRRGPSAWRPWLLCCLAAPPILTFALVSAWSSQRILYHWAAPGYLMLFPLLGEEVAARLATPWVRRTLIGTAALLLAAIAVIGTQERLDWLGPSLASLLRKDPSAEGIDWTSLRSDLTARGLLAPGTIVAVPNWRDAGKIGYALGPDVTVVCLSPDARQFGFARPPGMLLGHDMLILALDGEDRLKSLFSSLFDRLKPLPPATVTLKGRALQAVTVMQADGFRAWPPP